MVGDPISLLPYRLPHAYPAFLAAQEAIWQSLSANQMYAEVTWGILEKLLPFMKKESDPAGTIPFSFFPPGTEMVCLVEWWPSKSPEEWPKESQGCWPRILTSVELLSQLSHCQQLPPSGLLIKQEKTEPYLLKLISLVFSLICHWTRSSMINLLTGLCVSNPKPWRSIQYPTATVSAWVTS